MSNLKRQKTVAKEGYILALDESTILYRRKVNVSIQAFIRAGLLSVEENKIIRVGTTGESAMNIIVFNTEKFCNKIYPFGKGIGYPDRLTIKVAEKYGSHLGRATTAIDNGFIGLTDDELKLWLDEDIFDCMIEKYKKIGREHVYSDTYIFKVKNEENE